MKCLIVEDEALAANRLVRLMLEAVPDIKCFIASNGEDGLRQAKDKVPDLVLLDIRMPGMNGLEVASKLRKLRIPPVIIFCTAYEVHALEAIQMQVDAYLLKPVNRDDLINAINLACKANRLQLPSIRKIESNPRYISSVTHRGVETMRVDIVRCFIAEEKYVLACGENRDLLIAESLKDLELRFKDKMLRVHRKALVAKDYLLGIRRSNQGWIVSLDGIETQPPVSRRHLTRVRQVLADR